METDKSIENLLRKKNPEAKKVIKALSIIGFAIIFFLLAGYIYISIRLPHLLEYSRHLKEYRVNVRLDSLEGALFITGMKGCENILPVPGKTDVLVSCLDGYIYRLVPDPEKGFRIGNAVKAGEAVTGLAMNEYSELFAAIFTDPADQWKEKGGAVYRLSDDLAGKETVTGKYPSMNGICLDAVGNLYFASSNFSFTNPEGYVFKVRRDPDGGFGKPEVYIPDAGLANGLYFDPNQDRIFFSNTIGGVYSFTSISPELQEEYLKISFMEACDDLCTDSGGNIWMTDPGNSTVKMYNPGTSRLARFFIAGIGQTSSCRIRSENGFDILYITELKSEQKPMSENFDGRGVLVVPAISLIRLLEPYLIKM